MTKFIDKCIMCGSSELKTKTGSIVLNVGKSGAATKTPRIQYIECEGCGEKYTDADNESKIGSSKKLGKAI